MQTGGCWEPEDSEPWQTGVGAPLDGAMMLAALRIWRLTSACTALGSVSSTNEDAYPRGVLGM